MELRRNYRQSNLHKNNYPIKFYLIECHQYRINDISGTLRSQLDKFKSSEKLEYKDAEEGIEENIMTSNPNNYMPPG